MSILWPNSLFLLGLIPVLIAAYIWILRRRRRFAVRYSSLSLLRDALPRAAGWRRHIPFALFLLALTALIGSMARPAAEVSVPSQSATIVLAIDVSRSMCSMDIKPNRLQAAKQAAFTFISDQEPSTRIGIVAFAGFAELVQAPTNDQALLRNAVLNLTTARRTAIGSGIIKSIEALAEFDENIAPIGEPAAQQPPITQGYIPVTGSYAPAIIVLLTDGVSNSGPMPIEAAKEALARGLRVYTIGFGTANPGLLPDCRAQGPSFFRPSNQFGGGNGGGFFRGIDEQTLKDIAGMTGGEYYSATSSSELQEVFSELPTDQIMTHEMMEISALFAAVGASLAALAILLSFLLNPIS
jgi:Ca-activated chloride channel family protein